MKEKYVNKKERKFQNYRRSYRYTKSDIKAIKKYKKEVKKEKC